MQNLKNWYFDALDLIEDYPRVVFWLFAVESIALLVALVA